eukprot:2151799-Lingulodinium_polyedra.AAC.1
MKSRTSPCVGTASMADPTVRASSACSHSASSSKEAVTHRGAAEARGGAGAALSGRPPGRGGGP